MALLSHDLDRRLTTLTDAHLNWLEQIACNYTGPNPKGGILSALTEYRRWPEQERCKALAEMRSEEHTSELQSPYDIVCRLLLEKKKKEGKNARHLPQLVDQVRRNLDDEIHEEL